MADSDPFVVPPVPEQDQAGGDGLPTYDDLAAQHGPNSRFGRWREWIEKRAAERYADLTPADLERRRQKGWGEGLDRPHPVASHTSSSSSFQADPFNVPASQTYSSYASSSHGSSVYSPSMYSTATSSYASLPSHPVPPQLHLQTNFPLSAIPVSPLLHTRLPRPPAPLIPEAVEPSRLRLYNFGSRFLPHTTSPIRCLLPLGNHHILLIGHDNGLSVLDMFPDDCNEYGARKGPSDAEARLIWEGEGVHQMSILESESTGEGTPQGVVLALVSTEGDSSKEQEGCRVLRMYNLASLVSLAKWAVTQKDARPLDLRSSATGKQGSVRKHHRPPSSITKGLKNLVLDPGIAQPQSPSSRRPEPQTSYSSLASSWASPSSWTSPKGKSADTRTNSVDSEWDPVSDLPLRWATHFTPLASAGSRLQNNPVLFYDIWRNEAQRARGGALLAVATKSSILLYEAPKGERAFRLAKEFYTPLPARSITFVYQSIQDNMSRSPSDVFPRAVALDSHHPRHARVSSFGSTVSHYPTQLNLFVIFEKKAGTIRIADSAVGEVDLYEDNWSAQQSALMASPSVTARRSRGSWDGRGFAREKGPWVRPVKFSVPGPSFHSSTTQMYVLTRGRQSHILPYPLPAKLSLVPPYRVLYWSSTPNSVSARVCTSDNPDEAPFLQVVAFGEDGVEVQEVPLSQLSERKGKSRSQDPVRAQSDLGGNSGLLAVGGHWNRPFHPSLARSYSTSSCSSYESSNSTDEDSKSSGGNEGIYAWVQKGAEDWRVVWLGDGPPEDEDAGDDDLDAA